jgi:perosamine synthetase
VSGKKDPIGWFAPEMTGAEPELLGRVIDSNFLNDGPLTAELERRIAGRLGVEHCIAVTSGTAAIALSLMALGIGRGDEVIVPDLTFIATANAVQLTGATARLADVEPRRMTLDPKAVAQRITARTRAIVPVDVNGRGADYAALETLCRKHGLHLVCDSAEALGSSLGGRPLGAYGAAGCFSFSANKTVTTGQGGMIATNDSALHDRLRELKDQGRRRRGTGGDDLHPVLGFNFKYTDLQAAVGLAQLDRLDERLACMRERDRWYRDALAGMPGVEFPETRPGEICQWTDILVSDKAAVRRAFDAEAIGYRAFWYPLHRQEPYRDAPELFPASSDASDRGLWLPSRFDLTEAQVDRVARTLRTALRINA